MKIKFLITVIIYGFLLNTGLSAVPTQVIYPSADPRFAEYIEILRTALEKTRIIYGPYTMKVYDGDISESRYFTEVIKGKNVNVVWGASSVEREEKTIAIKIPLTKGLLGYRIGLIHSDTQRKFNLVKTKKELSEFIFGLGYGWGEVPMYKAAGFQVREADYKLLFKMLNIGRIDYFSRGVNEIWGEYDLYKKDNPKISIEKNILLHYVFPYYFFVTPKDKKLAERIEAGMREMIKDGSFNTIFLKYNSTVIIKANMDKRLIIEIDNPDLPPDTPKDPELWYTPKKKNSK